jgi:hypothetical protein
MNGPPGNAASRYATPARQAASCLFDRDITRQRKSVKIYRALQKPFGEVFWFLEKRIADLDVEILRRTS